MKVIALLFATAALASATFVGQNRIYFQEDSILFQHGIERLVRIYKPNQYNIAITVGTPEKIHRTILLNDVHHNLLETESVENIQLSQFHVLTQLFKGYQGIVDDVQFEKLLVELEQFVQKGLIHQVVYNYLRGLVYEHLWQEMMYQTIEGQDLITPVEKQGLGQYYGKYYGTYKNFYGQQYPTYKNILPYEYGYQYQPYGNFWNTLRREVAYPQESGMYRFNKYYKNYQTPSYPWRQAFAHKDVPQENQYYGQHYQYNTYPEYYQGYYYPQQTEVLHTKVPYTQYHTYAYPQVL